MSSTLQLIFIMKLKPVCLFSHEKVKNREFNTNPLLDKKDKQHPCIALGTARFSERCRKDSGTFRSPDRDWVTWRTVKFLKKRKTMGHFYHWIMTRAVARALIGGGGCIFIYSGSDRLVSFEIKLISKEVSRGRTRIYEYTPPPPISVLATALIMTGWHGEQ